MSRHELRPEPGVLVVYGVTVSGFFARISFGDAGGDDIKFIDQLDHPDRILDWINEQLIARQHVILDEDEADDVIVVLSLAGDRVFWN